MYTGYPVGPNESTRARNTWVHIGDDNEVPGPGVVSVLSLAALSGRVPNLYL